MNNKAGPIGIFDSGYGGLTVYKQIVQHMPQYDYIYLGDNARVPYGTRSFESVYQFTLECVEHLFSLGCRFIILACNTASAKALRSIQQKDLPGIEHLCRVLGVIRPTTEVIGTHTKTGHIGIFATRGTVNSRSYVIEIERFFPGVKVHQEACPMWVPLVENDEYDSPGADYFVKKHVENLLSRSPDIDTIVLACTHYPLLMNKIRQFLPDHIELFAQGDIVAESTVDYMQRHPEIDAICSKGGTRKFLTTDSADDFNEKAAIFLGDTITSAHLQL